MTRRVLRDTETGKIIEIDESPSERAERLERAAIDSSKRFAMTRGQRQNLARVGRSSG